MKSYMKLQTSLCLGCVNEVVDMKKRVVIVTDSLGCPRAETKVDETWVDKLLKTEDSGYYFYTYCKHGAHSLSIPRNDVAELNPDIIIVQLGIVDACRRAMSEKTEKVIKKIPGLRGIVHQISKKYHFKITKLLNIHYASVVEYKKLFEFFLNNTNAELIVCLIAPPGGLLTKKTYNIDNDIKNYNNAVFCLNDNRIHIIDPYKNEDDFLLADGHHLNANGIALVYNAVSEELKKMKEN